MTPKALFMTSEDHCRYRVDAALKTLFQEARSSEQAEAVERLRKIFNDGPDTDDGSE